MSEKIFVATRKGLFIFQRSKSGSWGIVKTSFLGDPVSAVLPDLRDNSIYVALNLGHFGVKCHRSEDGGESWQECPPPAYPKLAESTDNKPEQAADNADGTEKKGNSLTQIWVLETGGKDEPGLLWAGTIPGGLFRSRDGGRSWELINSLWEREERAQWFGGGYGQPGIHSIAVDPRDSRHITVGISCGGVWVSRDGGENWQCQSKGMYAEYMPPNRREDPIVQDPHRVVQCQSDPDRLWAQHHNGIFRSEDGAANWRDIKDVQPSTFGFAVAVHPQDGNTAWFVPAIKDERRIPADGRVVVTRTRDGGNHFDILRDGLPQEHAYDLVYRHGLDVDESGNLLAMGSTTGSLWVSEDQGDSWRALSTHLPPIYAVRFAK